MRPVTTEDQSCFSCAFWAGVTPNRESERRVVFTGQCRKNAPVLLADGTAGWPATAAEDWCAAYERGQTPSEAQRFL
jgi:hypothetical protein